ncbi:MAG: hypothetical protein ACI4E1_08835, partial [Lachnospira sp.]
EPLTPLTRERGSVYPKCAIVAFTIIFNAIFLWYFAIHTPLVIKKVALSDNLFHSFDADFSVVCQLSAFQYAA